MLTVGDLKKLTDIFATKQELEDLSEKVATKEDISLLMNLVDNVLGELKVMRENFSYNRVEHDEFKEDLQAIKSTPTIAHELKSIK